jgi:LPS-assembly protein
MRTRFFVCIMALFLCHPQVWTQAVSKQFPPQAGEQSIGDERKPQAGDHAFAEQQESEDANLPDAPSVIALPIAEPEQMPRVGTDVRIEAKDQRKVGSVYTLAGEVVIYYKDYVVRADKATYDEANDEVEAEGHLQLEGGADDEVINATHGTIHLSSQTGRFYDVTGTLGVRRAGHNIVYTTSNPFIFTGRVVIKSGPEHYQVVEGTMTSCRLPNPDWRLLARSIDVNNNQARAANSLFQLWGVPIFYLPYVSHPVDTEGRQSGFLIPVISNSSTKGLVIGEQVYWVINRSTDLLAGTEYFSKRGWAPNGRFRYRGRDLNFLTVQWNSLLDRGLESTHQNQGGVDLILLGRRDPNEFTRSIANVEYLSSYIYRQAFTENFNVAVSSEVKSQAFQTHNKDGFNSEIYFDRYQSFESTAPGDEVRILHLPSLNFHSVDRSLGSSRLYWGLGSSLAGLSRSEPGFQTSHEVARFDIYPHLTLPLLYGGWTFRPLVAVRSTSYTKSQNPGVTVPTERDASLNRSDIEAGMELRPPAMERDFSLPWMHRELRHVLEPEIEYSYVRGIGNFNSVLRFDTTDIASDTNEVGYFLTQHFFLRPLHAKSCAEEQDPTEGPCSAKQREWLTWRVGQKYFFDTTFGGALNPGRPNVLATTLDFSGVSFLVNPRDVSPVISRLRLHATDNINIEWDLDYDTRAGRIGASNLFTDYHHGNFAGGVTYANLAEPVETGTTTSITKFGQVRPFIAWGKPTQRGIGIAANAGYDFVQEALQYGGVQVSYNWDCCGLNFEYRRFALGSTRNENMYRFNFTLAGIGTAGNLRNSERLF